MDLIYIDEHSYTQHTDSGYTPNFTIPNSHIADVARTARKNNENIDVSALSAIGATLAVATTFSASPIGLILGAATVRPLLQKIFLSRQDSAQQSVSAEDVSIEIDEFTQFLQKHAITISMAEELGYKFPPGHPILGHTYKLHPLSKLRGSGKENTYIPLEKYDALLLEEREMEMLRLLVELGATKISISEKNTATSTFEASGEIAASAKMAASMEISAGTNSGNSLLGVNTREFELIGKPWTQGDTLDSTKFAWVAFEPSWSAVVTAREIGECTKATIEIKEETSFSTDKRISTAIESRLYGASLSAQALEARASGRVYVVRAEFAPFKCKE